MATTKKTDLDPTNQKQAQTVDDVNAQDARTRLWQSLNYTYGKQREESDKQFAQAYSQADRQALSRGMQRSSYNAQTLANLQQKGIEANNNIYAAQIADYQNRIGDIEQKELENERWEREFAANREDAAWNKEFQTGQFEYQKTRDTIADQQWQKQYDEQLRQFNENMAYQRERSKVSDAQWQKEYEEKLRQFNEQMAEERRQFDLNYNLQASAASSSGGGGGGSGSGGSSGAGGDTSGAGSAWYEQLFGDTTGGSGNGSGGTSGFAAGVSNIAANAASVAAAIKNNEKKKTNLNIQLNKAPNIAKTFK